VTDDRLALLFGASSLDRYQPHGPVLPGGGVLNMAWHWRRLGFPFRLLTRIGDDEPRTFLDFTDRHGFPVVADSVVGHGPSASIDIRIQPDRQPYMDHFVEGVWADLRSTPSELAAIANARSWHAVLVEGAIAEIGRLSSAGRLAHLEVSADFLSFRHYTVERFADTMRHVDLGFVGWPGSMTDPTIDGLRAVVRDLERLLVVTYGADGILVVDGRHGFEERFYPVDAIPVIGTTVGCGDAFIAGFLAEWSRTRDIARAVAQGQVLGALATTWRRPLPDDAYGAEAAAALALVDQEAEEQQHDPEDRDAPGDLRLAP
jgi:fructoselysine 6-kinase